MKRVLLIDNFDSFTYNLYQYLSELGCLTEVVRNNAVGIEEIINKHYSHIVISPGPGNPENEKDFGICRKVISVLGTNTPILGVCLGHQGIISVFGGRIIRARKPMHGKTDIITHSEEGIFNGVKSPLQVMRYHSLIAEETTLPSCLKVTARSTSDQAIMAVSHITLPIFGVQFHPESIMTQQGKLILKNFLEVSDYAKTPKKSC
ncbi:MAG: aminodeoxychorismate/anthranilate synthase component II [Candidatus Anstonellales archaeon]